MGDHVVARARRGDPDPDPAEGDLLAGGRAGGVERGLDVVVEHREQRERRPICS
jgi:hypothetical protein